MFPIMVVMVVLDQSLVVQAETELLEELARMDSLEIVEELEDLAVLEEPSLYLVLRCQGLCMREAVLEDLAEMLGQEELEEVPMGVTGVKEEEVQIMEKVLETEVKVVKGVMVEMVAPQEMEAPEE